MAATIAKAFGNDKSRVKAVHRLGHESSTVEAATWVTFATAHVNKDGSGSVMVRRDGRAIHFFEFGPEDEDAS